MITRLAILCLLCLCHIAVAAPPPFACSTPPVMVLDRTLELIPLTPFAEIIGASATEDVLTHAVTVTRGKATFTCTTNSRTALDNGVPVQLPCLPYQQGDVLYVPLRQVLTALRGQEDLDVDLTRGSARIRMSGDATLYKFPRIAISKLDDLARTSQVYVAYPDGSGRRRLTYHLGSIDDVTLSPDGKNLIYARQGSLYIRGIDEHGEGQLLTGDMMKGFYCTRCRFTPDSQEIIMSGYSNGGSLAVGRIKRDGSGFSKLFDHGHTFALLPDGKQIACAAEDQATKTAAIYLMNLDGSNQRQLGKDGYLILDMKCSRDGSMLAAEIRYRTPVHEENCGSSDGFFLVCMPLMGPDAEKPLFPTPKQLHINGNLIDISPDGKYVLYHHSINIEEYNELISTDLREVRRLPKTYTYRNLQFAPTGHQVLFTQGDVTYALDGETMKASPVPYCNPKYLTPDGKYLLFMDRPI